MKNIKYLIFSFILLIFMILISSVAIASVNITLTNTINGNNMDLSWTNSDTVKSYNYDVKKSVNNGEYKELDENNGDKVTVLNIYPDSEKVTSNITFSTYDGESITIKKSASLKRWMEEPNAEDSRGYGRGMVEVTPVAITDFNNNPSNYLYKNSDGKYNYDVVVFGTWDSNGVQDISASAATVMRVYLAEGNSCILGHDTIINTSGGAYVKANFNSLRNYFNIKLADVDGITLKDGSVINYLNISNNEYTNVTLRTNNVFTTYPWYIGEKGTILRVPQSHAVAQIAYGNVEITFSNIEDLTDQYGKGNWNYYLTVYNNTAMIQTGHSNCEATIDEQKIWANLIFYLGDVNTETTAIDKEFIDIDAPNIPTCVSNNLIKTNGTVVYSSEDNGTNYKYYVEASERTTNEKALSNTISETIKTEVAGYSYIIDSNSNTIVDNIIDTTSTSINYTLRNRAKTYLHIKAIDGAGNAGETLHLLLHQNIAPNIDLIIDKNKWTNESVAITVTTSDSDGDVVSITDPEGNIRNGNTLNYEVTENGTYEFIATDNSGATTTKTIVIDNIDKIKPDATYTVAQPTVEIREAVITINATDTLSGVEKIILPNNEEVEDDVATYNVTRPGNYKFIVVDLAGNEREVIVPVTITSGGVKVVHKTEDGIILTEDAKITGNVGDTYVTLPREYAEYEIKQVPENSNGVLTIDEIEVEYIYKIVKGKVIVTKVDNNDNTNLLSGATFKIQKLTEENTIDETFTEIEKTTGENGIVEFTELVVGRYRIIETKAPEGYSLNSTPIDFDISKRIREIQITASDKLKIQLPDTGGKGILIFNIVEILIIVLAVYIKLKNRYNKS